MLYVYFRKKNISVKPLKKLYLSKKIIKTTKNMLFIKTEVFISSMIPFIIPKIWREANACHKILLFIKEFQIKQNS